MKASRATISRAASALALRLMAPLTLAAHQAARPQAASASGAEEIRKAASFLPGYGPPDIMYPVTFRGRWTVNLLVIDVKTPLGEEAAPKEELAAARKMAAAGTPLQFDARFIDTGGGGSEGTVLSAQDGGIAMRQLATPTRSSVIADRAFNAERRAAAQPAAAALSEYTARWEASNPNVLTLSCRGSLVEFKVTKRSVDEPFDGAFGTSEYSRIADAGREGVLTAVPKISAQRVQTKCAPARLAEMNSTCLVELLTQIHRPNVAPIPFRYKWEPNPNAAVGQIEGLELTQVYDPTAAGFADPSGSTPVMTIKSQLTLTRQS